MIVARIVEQQGTVVQGNHVVRLSFEHKVEVFDGQVVLPHRSP